MSDDGYLDDARVTCEAHRHPAMFSAGDIARFVARWGKRVARVVMGDSRPKALDVLRRQYAEEIESIVRLKQHAAEVRHPEFARRLVEIARQEQRHAQALVRGIHALGGTVPKVSIDAAEQRGGWRALSEDLEGEKRCVAELSEALALAKNLDPQTTELLEGILRDECGHLRAITEMQMRSDPQS